jgi:glycosyltransferase involved in cell wall biosynthesis
MIYVCIPSHNEAPTVGLLLWKIRQVFTHFPREYQLLVADDGSTDATGDVLAPYARVLPLTVVRQQERRGYAPTVETLLRLALDRTDRPKRDCAIVMHADFAHGAQFIPDLVRRIDSGADLVVAEGTLEGESSRAQRLLRRWAPLLLRGSVKVPGVRDVVSGFAAFRLVTLRHVLRDETAPALRADGWAANAELLARAAAAARRIEAIHAVERHDLRQRPSRVDPWPEARRLWASRALLRQVPRAQGAGEARRAEVPAPEMTSA